MRDRAVYHTRHRAGDILATHRHRAAYAALVLDGSHVEVSPDGPVECTPGTLLLHPCYHIHGNRFGRTGAVVLNLTLTDERPMAQLSVLQVSDLQEAVATIARGVRHLRQLLDGCTAGATLVLHPWQHEFLSELEQGELPVSTLARRAGVSLAHASRTFCRSHGLSPQLLRRELRCRHALTLLAGDRPLADVAAASGFSDQSHLTRTLRLATGSTPSRLRRRVKSVQDRSTAVQP